MKKYRFRWYVGFYQVPEKDSTDEDFVLVKDVLKMEENYKIKLEQYDTIVQDWSDLHQEECEISIMYSEQIDKLKLRIWVLCSLLFGVSGLAAAFALHIWG